MVAIKGDWVRIHMVLLTPKERSANLPEDTKQVPMEMWDKGFLLEDNADIGDQVRISTIVGREISGRLLEVNPSFNVSYGECVPETLYIGRQLREMLGECNE